MQINAYTDDNIQDFLENLQLTPTKRQQLLSEIGSEMVELARQNFINQSFNGIAWQKSQRATSQSGQTLRDTGRLMNSLTFVIVPDGIVYGTNVLYAKPLHYGATITARNGGFLRFLGAYGWVSKQSITVPSRPFLGFGERERNAVMDILQDMLDEQSL